MSNVGTQFKKGMIPWNKKERKHCFDCKNELGRWDNPTRCNKCYLKSWKTNSENHPRWIEDRSKLKKYYGSEEKRSQVYKSWRRQVCVRDNFKCRIANSECSGRIEVHHILGWVDYPELRYEPNNGITLCHAHHPKKRAEEKRLIPTFQELVSVSNN